MHGYDMESARRLRDIEARETAGEMEDERSLALYGELPDAVWSAAEREVEGGEQRG